MDKKQIGSLTAKGGFANEKDICEKFNSWQSDKEAQYWLELMGYDFKKIKNIRAIQIPTKIKKENLALYNISEDEYENFIRFKKADIQIQLTIEIAHIFKIENISLKKANSKADFNQIDKRSVKSYQEMWKFDDDIALWLKLFSGEILPQKYPELLEISILKESRRIFANEMPNNIQNKIIDFFETNKILVINDILRGRGGLAVDWILVTRKNEDETIDWILKDINTALNFYGKGDVKISPKGSWQIGKITLQRKGGTPDPTKLQFKFKPCDLFEIEEEDYGDK